MYNNYNNPYYNPNFRPYEQPYNQFGINTQQSQQNFYNGVKTTLQGKQVDNIEVVRATDIPMDGSVSYFPLADNSAIVTKQLQSDGTSKITIYKPAKDDEVKEEIKYATLDDIKEMNNNLDELSDKFEDFKTEFKSELKDVRKTIKEK